MTQLTNKNARYAKWSFGITQTIDWHKPIDRLATHTSNYGYDPAGYSTINVPLTITAKKLTIDLGKKPYDGTTTTAGELASAYQFPEGAVVGNDNVTLTFTQKGNKTIKNADIYDFTAALGGADKANYELTKTDVSYEIEKLTLKISQKADALLSETYNGKRDSIEITDKFDFNGLLTPAETTERRTD